MHRRRASPGPFWLVGMTPPARKPGPLANPTDQRQHLVELRRIAEISIGAAAGANEKIRDVESTAPRQRRARHPLAARQNYCPRGTSPQ